MKTELIVIKGLELVPFFTKGDSVDQILEQIAKEARAHVPDVSTTKTRGEITANITTVTECKTYLEDERKKLADEYKLIPKKIDANGKKVKDFLTGLQKELRQPLTDWEAERKQGKDVIAFLVDFDNNLESAYMENDNRDLKAAQAENVRLAEIETAKIEAAAKATAKAKLEAAAKIKQAQLDTAAAEQREAKAKQDTKDAEWLTYIAEAYGINAKIDFDRQVATAAEEARKRQELDEWIQYISEAYAINDKLIATKNAQVAEAQRQQALADQQKRDQAAREADKNHKGSVNRAAMQAFIHAGLSQDQSILAVKAIAKGLIPAVTIRY